MRDVNAGWLIRYLHANGASFFLFWTYLHIARGLYYGSYRAPRRMLWSIGVIILVLMIGCAFLGLRSPTYFNLFTFFYFFLIVYIMILFIMVW